MKPTFSGKVAVVTGGAGGIGYSVAADLQQSGVLVAILDKKPDPIAEPREGRHYYRGDITDADFVAASIKRVTGQLGPPRYLVNAAGVALLDRDGGIVGQDMEVLNRTMQINLYGAILATKACLPHMLKEEGAIVHIASITGLHNMENIFDGGALDAYQMSKAALISLSRSLAIQYAPYQIRSNTVCSGAVQTPMTEEIYRDPERMEAMSSRTPLGRVGRPEDISFAALFLLADQASFITGIDLVADGGVLAKC